MLRRTFILSGPVMLALIFILFALAVSAAASSTTIIYAFAGGKDGEYLDTDLVVDAAGNIYGTSVQGGDFSSGTVWELSPSANGWTHTVLYSFHGGRDGSEPYKGVTLDAQGNLYGTTVAGGSGACDGGCGVVYKISNEGGLWVETVIHSFTGGLDGSGPGTGVTFDPRGNLYGMTPTGGAFGLGTIYELQPQTGGWKFRLIHAFTGGDDGASASAGRLTLDGKGNLYGVTTVGGANGDGVVFEVTRGDTGWTLIPLYAFQDQPDGALPYGGVIFDKAGNLYGATYYAGAGDVGAVYELSPSSGGWTETVLYSFAGGTDGSSPISTLVADKAGNLYGTTSAGGAPCGCGVIFKMTRKGASDWTESVVYRFPGAPGLSVAYNGMAAAADGSFYGATVSGGPANDGAIYRFVP